MFQLTCEEFDSLTSQIAMSKPGRGGRRTLPYAFTEHGALMAANILNSPRAVQMSVFVIRAFVKMRETLLGTRELAKKPALLEKKLTGRLDSHEAAIVHVFQDLMQILNPPPPPPGSAATENRVSTSGIIAIGNDRTISTRPGNMSMPSTSRWDMSEKIGFIDTLSERVDAIPVSPGRDHPPPEI